MSDVSDQEQDLDVIDIDLFDDIDDADDPCSYQSDQSSTIFLNNETPSISNFSIDREAMLSVQTHIPTIRSRIAAKLNVRENHASLFDPAEVFIKAFLSGRIMADITSICNKGLHFRKKRMLTEDELLETMGVMFACSFYKCSLTEYLSPDNKTVYPACKLHRDRVIDIVRSFDGAEAVDSSGSFKAIGEYDRDLAMLEESFASVCAPLLFVPGMDLSADDDVTRQRSKSLRLQTGLRQVVLPKAIGAQQTTISSPLLNLTLATRYAVPGETVKSTLEIILRRVQGHASFEQCNFNDTSTMYLDRGYSDAVATARAARLQVIATQKRGVLNPFDFGEGPTRDGSLHISEYGVLSESWAKKNWGRGLNTYHLAYRESTRSKGRVVTLFTTHANNMRNIWEARPLLVSPTAGNGIHTVPIQHPFEHDFLSVLTMRGDSCLDTLQESLVLWTDRQSSRDRSWFLARPLMFTSTVGNSFCRLYAQTRPFEQSNMRSCTDMLRCSGHSISEPSISQDITPVPPVLADGECRVMTVAMLRDQCRLRHISGYSGLNKEALISLLLNWTQSDYSVPLTVEERFAQCAFESWCLKPIKSTIAMENGTYNEARIQLALPYFFYVHADIVLLCAREYGLVSRRTTCTFAENIATSPDMVGAFTEDAKAIKSLGVDAAECDYELDSNIVHPAVFEFKTFSGSESIQKISDIEHQRGKYIDVYLLPSRAGDERDSPDELSDVLHLSSIQAFADVVPWDNYRYQLLHHALVFQCDVFFVACLPNEISYIVRIRFPSDFTDALQSLLQSIVHRYIPWVSTLSEENVPAYKHEVFGHGRDRATVSHFFNICKSFRAHVTENGVIPSARYIRPRLVALWNMYKGGTDVMSRVVKNNQFQFQDNSCKSTIVWRFVQIAAVNALYVARAMGTNPTDHTSYVHWRHTCANKLSYANCIKRIFQRLTSATEENVVGYNVTPEKIPSPGLRVTTQSEKARTALSLRLSKETQHNIICHTSARNLKDGCVRGSPHWCTLCSWTSNRVQGGIRKPQRRGNKTRYQCSECGVFLCVKERGERVRGVEAMSCWRRWHEEEDLDCSFVKKRLSR